MKQAEGLWQDYEFLTQEMDKFIGANKLDMFMELSRQREALQKQIENCSESAKYQVTPDGKRRLLQIDQLNRKIQSKLVQFRNQSVQQRNVSSAYEGLGQGTAGNFFNRST